MTDQEIIKEVLTELTKAKERYPTWPEDIIHAVSIMNEEAGETIQAALDLTYDSKGNKHCLKNELIQTAAMCFRCLENLDNYKTFPRQK